MTEQITSLEFGPNGAVIDPNKPAVPSPGGPSEYAYPDGMRPLGGLFKWMRLAVFAFIFAEVAISIFSVMIGLMGGIATAESSDMGYTLLIILGLIGIAYILIFIICVVFTGRWIYRAMKNLHTVGEQLAVMSPGWAVGWYFIPIANLWKPAEGMSQIYHGSANALHEKTAESSPIAGWWMSWLFMGIIAQISSRIPDYNLVTAVLDTLSAGLGIAAAVLLLRIARETTARQQQLALGGSAAVFD